MKDASSAEFYNGIKVKGINNKRTASTTLAELRENVDEELKQDGAYSLSVKTLNALDKKMKLNGGTETMDF